MKYGTGYANTHLNDLTAIRDFAQALDGAGFSYVTSSGHLLGAKADRYPERPNPTYTGPFYDPFVLFSYLSAITNSLGFRTSILILPLFPTGVIAKQAAELNFFSGGRFELGVGISWNPDEYAAAGADYRTRGARMAEQIGLLRRFWSEPYPEFAGRYHNVNGIGVGREQASRIPILFGSGFDEKVLRRVARLGDGWIPMGGDPSEPVGRLRQYLKEADRDHVDFGLTGRLLAGNEGPASWVEAVKKLQALGFSHVSISAPPDLHGAAALQRLLEAKKTLDAEMG